MARSAHDPAPRDNSGNPARQCAILRVEPPREPFGNINMARRRGIQKGYLHKQGNMWYIAFREDALDEAGKIVRVRRNVRIGSVKELSKREARRIADEQVLSRVNSQAVQPASLVTIRQFVESSFRPEVIWALKHAGKQHYENLLKQHIIPALGDRRLRDLLSDDIQNLVRLKIEARVLRADGAPLRNVISAVFSHAQRKHAYFGENPANGVRLPEMQRKQAHALTFEQGKAVLAALPSPVAEMALVSMTCSLNVAELLGPALEMGQPDRYAGGRRYRGPAPVHIGGAAELLPGPFRLPQIKITAPQCSAQYEPDRSAYSPPTEIRFHRAGGSGVSLRETGRP